MFSGKQIEQMHLQLREYEEELDIKTNEIERLHMQIFDLKKDMAAKEEQSEKQLIEMKSENDVLSIQFSEMKSKA